MTAVVLPLPVASALVVAPSVPSFLVPALAFFAFVVLCLCALVFVLNAVTDEVLYRQRQKIRRERESDVV